MDDPFLRDTSNKRNDKVHGSITVRDSPQKLKVSWRLRRRGAFESCKVL